jgi:prepilin-type N-terminal cleavage/methylation domain-containing protein
MAFLNNRLGFTLIELVVVIALIGILSVGVVVMSVNFSKTNITVVAQKIRSDIEYARSLAMTKKGTTFGAFFNDTSDEYTVYESAVGTPILDPLTKQSFLEDFSKWSGVTITGGDYTVEFNRVGVPIAGGGGNVQITETYMKRTQT